MCIRDRHLSTQAGVCNGQGVSAAARLGYERVVLARETNAQEIKKAAEKNVEIEVFVHGALCICYSGQCQLSRGIGGRSGNKGTCAQPCRLPYRGSDGKYPLSPRDPVSYTHLDVYKRQLMDFGPEEIRYLLDLAKDLKANARSGIRSQMLKGKNICLLFEKTSTRTRCAFCLLYTSRCV